MGMAGGLGSPVSPVQSARRAEAVKGIMVKLRLLISALFLLAIAPLAHGDTLYDNFTLGNCTSAQLAQADACGLITISDIGPNLVSVSVVLGPNEGWIDTGTHTTFTFNIDWPSNPAVTVTMTGDSINEFFVAPPPDGNPPFGTFSVGLTCLNQPNGCGTGGSDPLYDKPLTFNVSYANPGLNGDITVYDFTGNGNTPPIYFAADILNTKNGGNTGAIGALKPSLIPEPGSMILLGSGALAALFARKRRKAN